MLAQGHADPATPLDELFRRALALTVSSFRPGGKMRGRYETVIGPALAARWAGSTLADVTVASLGDWFVTVHKPAKDSKGLTRSDVLAVLKVVYAALYLDRVDAAAGEVVVGGALFLIPAWSAAGGGALTGMGGTAGGLGSAIGALLGRQTGRHRGDGDTVARHLPNVGMSHLLTTGSRVLLVPGQVSLIRNKSVHPVHVAWSLPLAEVAGARRVARFQLMRRLSVEFRDGSAADFMTTGKGTFEAVEHALT